MTTNCPSPAELLAYALGSDGERASETIARHVATCETCRTEVMAVSRIASELRANASATVAGSEPCLDEFAISELVEGSLDAGRRAQVIAHVAACSRCRTELGAVSRLLADPRVRAEQAKLTAFPRRTRIARVGALGAAAVAAAAAVLLLIGEPADIEDPSSALHRGPELTASIPPVVVAPAGTAGSAATFVWTSVPRADRYELTVFDDMGSVVWRTQTADTTSIAPDAVVLRRSARYFWRVRARIGFDRWADSDLVEFTITGPQDGAR